MNRKNITRKVVFGASVAAVVVVVVFEKRRVDELIKLSQAAVQETMTGSFNEGVKFGLETAKTFFQPDAKSIKDASDYAFAAFDR